MLGSRCGRSFLEPVVSIGVEALPTLGASAGPGDLDGNRVRLLAQAEVQAQVVLRKVARATAHFVDLREAAGVDADTCADAGAIAAGADELEPDPVVTVRQPIAQEA